MPMHTCDLVGVTWTRPANRLFTCLGLDPGSLEIRISLICHFIGSPSTVPFASQEWLERLGGDDFLQGLYHLLRGDLDRGIERWTQLASRSNAVAGFQALELPEELWSAVAQHFIRTGHRSPLTVALLAAQRVPAAHRPQLEDAADSSSTEREKDRSWTWGCSWGIAA